MNTAVSVVATGLAAEVRSALLLSGLTDASFTVVPMTACGIERAEAHAADTGAARAALRAAGYRTELVCGHDGVYLAVMRRKGQS